ncbi:hypothetical protein GWK47_053676 [Chionoecetes opilio]|uniref:Uncharacterized protein n=1 Tax=Chionoecetes opilio TaxID=41210 RepID=A0A8J4YAG9_CHIOP|nr:hypothetical protein GWK47_053676 [Chionoecetes opilio]
MVLSSSNLYNLPHHIKGTGQIICRRLSLALEAHLDQFNSYDSTSVPVAFVLGGGAVAGNMLVTSQQDASHPVPDTNTPSSSSPAPSSSPSPAPFAPVRRGARRQAAVKAPLTIKTYNKFQVLGEMKEDVHETRLIGDSILRGQLVEFCGRVRDQGSASVSQSKLDGTLQPAMTFKRTPTKTSLCHPCRNNDCTIADLEILDKGSCSLNAALHLSPFHLSPSLPPVNPQCTGTSGHKNFPTPGTRPTRSLGGGHGKAAPPLKITLESTVLVLRVATLGGCRNPAGVALPALYLGEIPQAPRHPTVSMIGRTPGSNRAGGSGGRGLQHPPSRARRWICPPPSVRGCTRHPEGGRL